MRHLLTIALLVSAAGCTEHARQTESGSEAEPDAGSCEGVVCDPDSLVADPCCTVAPPSTHLVIGAVAANAASPTTVGGPDYYGHRWVWPSYGTFLFYPLTVAPGCHVSGVSHRMRKASSLATVFTVAMIALTDDVATVIGAAATSADAPGLITVSVPIPATHTIAPDVEYAIRVTRTGGPSGTDHSFWSAADIACP